VTRYDSIGASYARTRRADPRIARRIETALGDARRVVNVGAGTGNYEPAGRRVVAVEPSRTMLAQRPAGAAPAVQAAAEHLPFSDHAFDAALAVLTVHHWSDLGRGLREMQRVAPRQVVFYFEPSFAGTLWLIDEYFPEITALQSERAAPDGGRLAARLHVLQGPAFSSHRPGGDHAADQCGKVRARPLASLSARHVVVSRRIHGAGGGDRRSRAAGDQ